MSKSKKQNSAPKPAAKPAVAAKRPAPLQNPAFKKAVAAMKANDTPQNRNVVINEMMRATFLAPVKMDLNGQTPKPDAQGKIQVPPNTKVSFTLIGTQDGKQFFMAFTDIEELKKWNKTPQTTVMLHFDDYARLLAQNPKAAGFVINPFGENLRFDPATVASLKQQKDNFAKMPPQGAHRIDPGAKVVLLDPSVMPDEMLNPMCEVFKQHEEVRAAFLQIMLVNDKDKSYLLVLDAPQNAPLLQQAAIAARPFLEKNKRMNLDITVSTSPLGQQVVNDIDPFYTKEQGRIYDKYDEDEEE